MPGDDPGLSENFHVEPLTRNCSTLQAFRPSGLMKLPAWNHRKLFWPPGTPIALWPGQSAGPRKWQLPARDEGTARADRAWTVTPSKHIYNVSTNERLVPKTCDLVGGALALLNRQGRNAGVRCNADRSKDLCTAANILQVWVGPGAPKDGVFLPEHGFMEYNYTSNDVNQPKFQTGRNKRTLETGK